MLPGKALDVTFYLVPNLGDDVLAYGIGVYAYVWVGSIAREVYGIFNCSSRTASHWTGATRICDGEFLAQGHQHEGMSGAAVLNGCGYLGMAHAAQMPSASKLANFAALIPASEIIKFIDQNLARIFEREAAFYLDRFNRA